MLGSGAGLLLYFMDECRLMMLLLPLKGTEGGATVIERGIQFAAEGRVETAAAQIIFGPPGEFIMRRGNYDLNFWSFERNYPCRSACVLCDGQKMGCSSKSAAS